MPEDQTDLIHIDSSKVMRAIVETVSDGIITCDTDSNIVSCNPAMEKMFGYGAGELVGESLDRLIPKNYANHKKELQTFSKAGTPRIMGEGREVSGVHKMGHILPLEIGISKATVGETMLLIAVVRDITERKEADARLHHLAMYDQLTGLPNRTNFEKVLRRFIFRSKRYGTRFAVLFCDLNKFKEANDAHGHKTGDYVLKAVAERLLECTREGDHVARIGGDEFVLLAEAVNSKAECQAIAQKAIKALEEPINIAGYPIEIGVSVGIALFPDDGPDEETMLKHADLAMYKAKKQAEGHFAFFDDAEVSNDD
jgi:diguanylate cyclase (GGDEF)-like protein/PAS domain S-box-containing protein